MSNTLGFITQIDSNQIYEVTALGIKTIKSSIKCLYGHFRVDGMSKIRTPYHEGALIVTIPMYCVKKSNFWKVREKNVLFVAHDVMTISCA